MLLHGGASEPPGWQLPDGGPPDDHTTLRPAAADAASIHCHPAKRRLWSGGWLASTCPLGPAGRPLRSEGRGAEDGERGKDSVETGGVEHLEVEDWWRTKGWRLEAAGAKESSVVGR